MVALQSPLTCRPGSPPRFPPKAAPGEAPAGRKRAESALILGYRRGNGRSPDSRRLSRPGRRLAGEGANEADLLSVSIKIVGIARLLVDEPQDRSPLESEVTRFLALSQFAQQINLKRFPLSNLGRDPFLLGASGAIGSQIHLGAILGHICPFSDPDATRNSGTLFNCQPNGIAARFRLQVKICQVGYTGHLSWKQWPVTCKKQEGGLPRKYDPASLRVSQQFNGVPDATHLLKVIYGIKTVLELLGYSDVKTTMIYTHVLNWRPAGSHSGGQTMSQSRRLYDADSHNYCWDQDRITRERWK